MRDQLWTSSGTKTPKARQGALLPGTGLFVGQKDKFPRKGHRPRKKKVHQPDRKAVAAKDVVSILEAYENDIRECQILTGNNKDNTMMVVN